jgi:serine/threonine-protein kinase
MGVVYKAEQRLGSTLRKVAVKTLHAELSRDPSITARFHREVGTIAQLEHPNTVKVYDFGSTDDGTLYIAMEFLDGRPLNRVIQTEGALEPRRVANLLRQIGGSLDEAHRQGIIHRDLKPENVLLIERAGEKDVVKLVDFGIAARTESADRAKEQKLTQQGMVLGTPPYMSPEQFTGKALDARTDVYSLGIMTYEMLTGQLPFEADTPWQWATHHMTSQPRSFDDLPGGSRLPEAARRAVLKALAKDPNDRQSSAGQFQTEFSAALVGIGTVPPRPVHAPAPAGNKTEAMPEATPFAVAATEAMAAASPLTAPRSALASPPGPVALPPAPAREASATGGRGLIYGLSGVGAVLLIAMGVVVFGNRQAPPGEPGLDLRPTEQTAPTREGTTEATSATATEIAPEPAELKPDEPTPQAPRPNGTKTPASSSATPKTPAATPATTPASTPPKTPPSIPPQLPSTPGVKPPPGSPPLATSPATTAPVAGDACAACARLANSKDVLGASTAYAQCANPDAKAKCSQRVGAVAPNLALFAANNTNCPLAHQIMAAATGMGVSADRFKKAQAVCK